MNDKKKTFLHVAVENDALKIISQCQKMTIDQSTLDATNGEGFTALGMACRALQFEIGLALIEAGVNVDKLSV